MADKTARDRLCQVILGGKLGPDLRSYMPIPIPINHRDITANILIAARETIYDFSPADIRQMLPFVLDTLQRDDTELLGTMYVSTFLGHVAYEFSVPRTTLTQLGYRQEYRQNWTAGTLSALSGHEHAWAYEWVCQLLKNDDPVFLIEYAEDLTMVARMLAMALSTPEVEAPAFRS